MGPAVWEIPKFIPEQWGKQEQNCGLYHGRPPPFLRILVGLGVETKWLVLSSVGGLGARLLGWAPVNHHHSS